METFLLGNLIISYLLPYSIQAKIFLFRQMIKTSISVTIEKKIFLMTKYFVSMETANNRGEENEKKKKGKKINRPPASSSNLY